MKLTVIIPVYNGREYIVRCLESLNAQTYRNFKVILINDGSTDDSSEVIQQYIADHPEISLEMIEQENRGVAETRNAGIRECDSDYIAFMDQDDEIAPEYFQNYVEAMETSEADIVCGGYQRVDPVSGIVSRTVQLRPDPWSKFVVTAPWAHLYRTSFLKENPVRFLKTSIGEDIYFSLMAYAYTDRVTILTDIGYKWIDNPKSHSNSNQRKVQDRIDPFILLDAIDRDLPEPCRISREHLEYFLYRYIIWYLLFVVRSTPRRVVLEQYNRMILWISERYPRFSHNHFISLFRPVGEPFSIRFAVWGFNMLYRLRLAPAFLSAFSRKTRREDAD